MNTNDTILEEIANSSAIALFADYGSQAVSIKSSAAPSLSYAAVLGFTGESMRGTMMLGMSAGALTRTRQTGNEKPREWIGELANQLLGRIKNRLLRYSVEIYLSTPVVIRGEHLSHDGSTVLEAMRFDIDGESVAVWLDREEISGLVLVETADAGGATEGDIVLF